MVVPRAHTAKLQLNQRASFAGAVEVITRVASLHSKSAKITSPRGFMQVDFSSVLCTFRLQAEVDVHVVDQAVHKPNLVHSPS